MQSYFYFLLIIFFFKIINTLLDVIIFYHKILNITDSDTVIFWANIMDFMYKFSMGVLLLFIFGPAVVIGKLCINDKYMSYELVKDEKEYSTDDITKIVFKEIICDKENINKI